MQHNFSLQLLMRKSKAGAATHLAYRESFQSLSNCRVCAHCSSPSACPLPVLQTSLHICKACLAALALDTVLTLFAVCEFSISVLLFCAQNSFVTQRKVQKVWSQATPHDLHQHSGLSVSQTFPEGAYSDSGHGSCLEGTLPKDSVSHLSKEKFVHDYVLNLNQLQFPWLCTACIVHQ